MQTLTQLIINIETAKQESASLENGNNREEAIKVLEKSLEEYDSNLTQEIVDNQYKEQSTWRNIVSDITELRELYPGLLYSLGRLYLESSNETLLLDERRKAKELLEKVLELPADQGVPIKSKIEDDTMNVLINIYAPFGLESKPSHPFNELKDTYAAVRLKGRSKLVRADLETRLNNRPDPDVIAREFLDYADRNHNSADPLDLLTQFNEATEAGRSLNHASIWARDDKQIQCRYLDIFGQFYALRHLFEDDLDSDFKQELDRSLEFFKGLEEKVEKTPDRITVRLDDDTYIAFAREAVPIDCVNDVSKFSIERSPKFADNIAKWPYIKIDLGEIVKIYRKDTSPSDVNLPVYFWEKGIKTALPLNDEPIPLKTTKGKTVYMNRFERVNGECLYDILNKGIGEEEKRDIFIDSLDILAKVHYHGLKIEGLTNPIEENKKYFTEDRIVGVLVDKLKDKLGSGDEGIFDRLTEIFTSAYEGVNDLLVQLSREESAYYRDGAPRNQMITKDNKIILIDFESNRKLWRGFDLISLLECGMDYTEDSMIEDERRDYLTETQKRNLVDRYLLVAELLNTEGNDTKREQIDQLLKKECIDSPDIYSDNQVFQQYISQESRDDFQDLIWGVAKMHRHLEYMGYSARDIRKSIDNDDQERIDINRRCLRFHYETAYEGYQKLSTIRPDMSGLDKLQGAFDLMAELCDNENLTTRIDKLRSQGRS